MTRLSIIDRMSIDRAKRDPEYRRLLLVKAANALIEGDMQTAKQFLRDHVNATIGFEELATRTHGHAKSLMRMLSQGGNPSAANISQILACLQRHEKARLIADLIAAEAASSTDEPVPA